MGAESFLTLQIVDFAEGVDDRVAALLQAGTGITLTYNDGAGTLTIASTVSPTWGSIGGTLSSQTDLQTALNAKMGGSTGSTDNRVLRADGTGGATVQNSAVTIDDSGNISGLGTVGCGAITASGAGGQVINIVRAGLTSFGLGDKNGDSFRIYNNNTNTDLLVINATSRLVECGAIVSSALVTVGTYTVATLPSAAANAGALAQVTDSSVTANGSAVSGSGSNRVLVFSNGSTWDVVVA